MLDVAQLFERPLTVTWTLDGDGEFAQIDDPYSFTFSITPETTTQYRIEATIDDGKQPVTVNMDSTVKQLAFLGTWRATAAATPAHAQPVDLVGIWYINGFNLYYLDANGGTEIKDYSARGTMTFPNENTWITLHQEQSWDEGADQWQAHVETMYAMYHFVGDQPHMTVVLDLQNEPGTDNYSWDFTKIDDTVDPWW